MNDLHIAIFSRAPVPGEAKTRLIPLLGEEGAASAQRQMAWLTLETACAARGASVSLWCAGDIDHPFLRACASHFNVPCLPQADSDLGLRMAHCLQTALVTHRKALLIGTDCPVFDVGALEAAATALDTARMVFTPAEDGGYVLVGAHRGGLELRCFDKVAWSTAQVMVQTRQRLREAGWQQGRDWHEMPVLWDVDTPADYLRAQALPGLR